MIVGLRAMARKKIKLEEEAISEILVSVAALESGAEASDVEDYFDTLRRRRKKKRKKRRKNKKRRKMRKKKKRKKKRRRKKRRRKKRKKKNNNKSSSKPQRKLPQ